MSAKSNVTAVELGIDAAMALDVFNAAKKAKKAAEEQLKDAEHILRAALGSATVGTVNGIVAVKVIAGQNSHIDKAELQRIAPEVLAETLVVTPYTYLRTA